MRERDTPRPGRGVVHRGSDKQLETHSEEKREIKTEILRDKKRSPDPPRKSEKAGNTGRGTEAEGKGHSRRETQTYKNHKKPRGRLG